MHQTARRFLDSLCVEWWNLTPRFASILARINENIQYFIFSMGIEFSKCRVYRAPVISTVMNVTSIFLNVTTKNQLQLKINIVKLWIKFYICITTTSILAFVRSIQTEVPICIYNIFDRRHLITTLTLLIRIILFKCYLHICVYVCTVVYTKQWKRFTFLKSM